MADVRVIPNVVLSDPTTPSQIAAVDASGRQSVSLTASSATVTVDSELSVAASLTDNFANPTAGGVGAFNMLWDSATWDRAPGTAADGALVNLGANNDVTVTSGSITADTELPTAAALTADAVASPTAPAVGAFGLGYNGTTWDRVRVANTGRLQVDVITGGGSNASVLVDNAGFTDGTSSVTGVGFIFDEVAGTGLTENDIAAARIDSKRAQVHVIEDATTRGQRMAVDASGRITSNIFGTVVVDTELGAAAAISAENTAAPTAPNVYGFNMLFDGTNWDRAPGTSTDGTLVNLGTNNDVTVTSGNIVADTELLAAAAMADATANPTITQIAGYTMGFNGTTWDRVRTANTGRLQVDVITGGGSDSPTNPINSYDTTAAVAAGATDNHDTADFGAATKKVAKVIYSASVPLKAELQYVDNNVGTTLAVGFSQAGGLGELVPSHRNFWSHTFTANAGADLFRLIRTNLDASEAADIYSVIQYED
jgi:hypothetical protein